MNVGYVLVALFVIVGMKHIYQYKQKRKTISIRIFFNHGIIGKTMNKLLLGIIPFLVIFVPQISHETFCWETLPDGGVNDLCGLASGNITKVFSGVNQPIETVQPGFSYVILWGGILGIIWFKTERIDILGIVGVMVSGSMVSGGASGFLSPQATGIGFLLMFVSMGILLFQVIRQRITIFT